MSLFIGGISHRITEAQLREVFKPYGELTRVDHHGRYAFVDFKEKEDGKKAMDELQGLFSFFLHIQVNCICSVIA